ncbi:MAG: hypothetical protein WKG01_26585 [Kofleriaceae bacterium]
MTSRVPKLVAILALALGCGNRSDGSVNQDRVGSATGGGSSIGSGSNAPAPAPAPGSGSQRPRPGDLDHTAAGSGSGSNPVIHGDKWSDTEKGGQAFKAFKESWVYVDGMPRGVLLYPEVPVGLPVAWKDDVEGLDFLPGHKGPKTKKVQLMRYRLADYLQAIGVDLKKIKYVYLHGKGLIEIPGDRFRKFAYGITFDWVGNNLAKTRFFWPTTMKTNTAYDRYVAVSVFIDKPRLTLDRHSNPFIGGQEVFGIPYFGSPLRGGFRVYVDNKLATIIKRNELGTVGRTNLDNPKAPPEWDLRKLLESQGVKVEPVAGDLVISKDLVNQKRTRLDEAYVKNLRFKQESESSGGLLLGKDALSATALHLYTKGHVPAVGELPVLRRDWQPSNSK